VSDPAPGSLLSTTSMRKSNDPPPLTVAVPKMLADVPAALHVTAWTLIEWTFMFVAGPWSWYSS